jgi:hypothetical protein
MRAGQNLEQVGEPRERLVRLLVLKTLYAGGVNVDRQKGHKAMSGSTRVCGTRRESKTWRRKNSGRERARWRLTPDILTTDSYMEQNLEGGNWLGGARGKLRVAAAGGTGEKVKRRRRGVVAVWEGNPLKGQP